MHFFEKSARALAILEPHLDPESAKNRIVLALLVAEHLKFDLG